jgi:hypothetical protein
MEIATANTIINIPSVLLQRQVEPPRPSNGASEDVLDSPLSITSVGENGATGAATSVGELSSGAAELFSVLAQRLQDRTGISIDVSVSINVIKANLGNLLSTILTSDDSNILDDLLAENLSQSQVQEADPDVRARLFSALATAGLDDGGLFTSAGTLDNGSGSGIIGALSSGSTDGRELLLNLLVNELNTPEDDAFALISIFQENRFEIVI